MGPEILGEGRGGARDMEGSGYGCWKMAWPCIINVPIILLIIIIQPLCMCMGILINK